MTTKAKTVKEHLDATDQLAGQLKSADAMVVNLRDELMRTRETLGELEHFSPAEHFKLCRPYGLSHLKRGKDEKELSMSTMLNRQISNINKLLGDRAE